MDENIKPGAATSEFWGMIAGQGGIYWTAFSDPNPWIKGLALCLSTGLLGLYIWARRSVKCAAAEASQPAA